MKKLRLHKCTRADAISLSFVQLYERNFYEIEGNWLHGTSLKHLQRGNTISRVTRRLHCVSCRNTVRRLNHELHNA